MCISGESAFLFPESSLPSAVCDCASSMKWTSFCPEMSEEEILAPVAPGFLLPILFPDYIW